MGRGCLWGSVVISSLLLTACSGNASDEDQPLPPATTSTAATEVIETTSVPSADDETETTASPSSHDQEKASDDPSEQSLEPLDEVVVPAHCQQPERTVTDGRLDHGLGQGSTELSGPAGPGDLKGYPWVVGDDQTVRVLAMDCDAGGVTWPGVLVFYDEAAQLVGTVWLTDLGDAAKGSFGLDGASQGEEGLRVDYSISPGGGQFTDGSALIRWEDGPTVVDQGDDQASNVGGTVIEVPESAYFVTPSGNIACAMDEGMGSVPFTACDIIEAEYPIEVAPSEDTPPGWDQTHCEEAMSSPRTLVLAPQEVFWECSNEPIMFGADVRHGGSWIGDGPTIVVGTDIVVAVLDYGETLRGPAHECTSSQQGVTCQDRDGEHGFTLSRRSFETW